ncbi:MAG: NUDIX domain-containing protein [Spirochaetia bacterium]|nr:NUDIX domain-containing protein [Spirochaetia bacterium]
MPSDFQHKNRFRAGCLILSGDRVLLESDPGIDLWYVPGGGVEPGETLTEAARREMKEELSVDVSVLELRAVVERHFSFDEGARRFHEIGFYFFAKHPLEVGPDFVADGKVYRWHLIEQIASLPMVPEALGASLQKAILNDRLEWLGKESPPHTS